MNSPAPRRHAHLWLEYAFIPAILAGYAYALWFFIKNSYLPQPFFFEPYGTFMDWYSLTSFAQRGEAYSVNGTIYPPLSFVLMKMFGLPNCYINDSYEYARDCDWLGSATLVTMLAINVLLTFAAFRKIDRRTYIPRAFALSLGLPMVFAFERGNLLLFCYACLLLGFGPLLRSARLRWFFAGMAVNFKVYLIGALLAPLLSRRWLVTECMLIAAACVYLVSYAILGEGSPVEIVRNITSYAAAFGSSGLQDLWYASSMIPAITLLEGTNFPITSLLGSQAASILLVICVGIMRGSQLLIVLAAVATWLRPEAVPRSRPVFFAATLALISSEAGGYTLILLLFFVFQESWKGIARPIALTCAFMLCVPVEYVSETNKLPPMAQTSWLAGNIGVFGVYGFGYMALIRPFIFTIMLVSLTSLTIKDVAWDIWQQRWKTRFRFRRDFPILSGEGEARRPVVPASHPASG